MVRLVTVRIKGIAPLILHNGQTKDPLNEFSKAMKEITSKRKKTDEDHKALAEIEWMAGLYVNDKGHVIIPGLNIEACIVEGAKKSKMGQQFKAALFIDEDAILEYSGPKDVEKLKADKNHRLTVGVTIGTSSVMRTRPIFRDWSAEFKAQYSDDVISSADLKRAIDDAGRLVGMCDWTPRHGRFVLESIK